MTTAPTAAETATARAYYVANRLGGGNPEAVITRELIQGRFTAMEWRPAYIAARGSMAGAWELPQGLVRSGFLTFDAASSSYALTAQADAWIVEAVEGHRVAMAKLAGQYPAVFRGHDAEGLAIFTNVAL